MPELSPAPAPLAPRFQGRLDATRAELKRLSEALARRPHPEERAVLAGALLGTTGYLLRRSGAFAADTAALDAALAALPREDLQAWLAGASAAGLRRALQHAADAAFEAALGEEEGERERYQTTAMEGLAERERLASALHALDRWEQLQGPLDDRARRRREALLSETSRIDASLRNTAVTLAHLNEERRAERDLLDEPLREGAWWYSRHAGNDDLAALPFGAPVSLAPSPRATAALQAVHTPPTRHLSEEELWAFDLGLLDENQRAWVHRHSLSCADCKQAIRALSEGEQAIHEALGQSPPRQAAETDHEVVFDHPQFRVLAFSGKKPRLVLEEKRPGSLASAQPLAGIKPRRLRDGFEFQLPPRLREPLRLRVALSGGEELTVPVG